MERMEGFCSYLFVGFYIGTAIHIQSQSIQTRRCMYVCMYVLALVCVWGGRCGGGEAEVRGGVVDKVQDLLEMSRSRR